MYSRISLEAREQTRDGAPAAPQAARPDRRAFVLWFLRPAILLCCWTLVGGSGWWSVSAQVPEKSCADAWKALISENLHVYRFDRDARFTEYGNQGYQGYAERVKRCTCRKQWTILIYMVAKNDLTPYVLADLHEMEAGPRNSSDVAGSGACADVLVQADLPGQAVRRLHIFQSSEPYDSGLTLDAFEKRTLSDVKSPIVCLGDNSKKTQFEQLRDFLVWGVVQYPAEHYMVIISGHGEGWAPRRWVRQTGAGGTSLSPQSTGNECDFTGVTFRTEGFPKNKFGGFNFDEDRGLFLDVQSVRDALAYASEIGCNGRPFDILVADSCLMQMVEVATELSGVARYIVGSAQIVDYIGLPYRRILTEIEKGQGCSAGEQTTDDGDLPRRTACAIPAFFKASMGAGGSPLMNQERVNKFTMSVLSGRSTANALVPALSVFSDAMADYLLEPGHRRRAGEFRDLLEAKESGTGVGGAARATKYAGSGDLMAHLWLFETAVDRQIVAAGAATPAALKLKAAIQGARTALDRTTVRFALGELYSHKGLGDTTCSIPFRGVSAWFPSKHEYFRRRHDFRRSEFDKRTNWSKWIGLIHDKRKP